MARMPLPVRFAALSRLPLEVVAVFRILSTPGHSSHFMCQMINFDHSLSIGLIVDISVAHSQTDIERKLCCSTFLRNVYSRPMTRKIEKKDPAKRSIECATCAIYNVKLPVCYIQSGVHSNFSIISRDERCDRQFSQSKNEMADIVPFTGFSFHQEIVSGSNRCVGPKMWTLEVCRQ